VPCTSRRPEAIAATYDNDDNRTAVLTPEPDVTSATYDVKGGLREGAVLPPCLYNIFMAGLTRELKAPGNKQHGMHVGKEWMGAQMWADDLITAAAHKKWDDAGDHMHHLMGVTKVG
jgi:hypothetical protein